MYLEAASSTQSTSDAGNELDSLTGVDLNYLEFTPSVSLEFVPSPQFADLTMFPPLQSHDRLLYSAYTSPHTFLSQAPYQFSQPTTPISVPTPLNQPFDIDPNAGMCGGYSPIMDHGSHFSNQAYPSRNVPLIRLDTTFPTMGVSPAHLSGSSSTPSTFNTPIHGLRHISPFTNSPTSPLPQVNVSGLFCPLFVG